jgi:16S rRNA (uracil1498-N3)-methyltransferase
MHKFFVDAGSINGQVVCITGDDVKHLSGVLRLKKGELIQVCDGKSSEYICSISEIEKKQVICHIEECFKSTSEPPISITLYQGLPKAQKMDLIVQKCTEIGVCRIVPVKTSRVVVRAEEKDLGSKLDRWRRIAEEAAKQSNRGRIPEIGGLMDFKTALQEAMELDLAVMPYEQEKAVGLRKAMALRNGVMTCGIFIGPEGGFEDEEVSDAMSRGITPVTLGPRILRTETAGFVSASCILYEIGDIGGSI